MLRDFKTRDDLARALRFENWEAVKRVLTDRPYRRNRICEKGKWRLTWAPSSRLKDAQARLAEMLNAVYVAPHTVHGYVAGRSIVTNAECHVRQQHVMSVDLRHFFGSITYDWINTFLQRAPYEIEPQVAQGIAALVTHAGVLPMGAPTSPVLSNMALLEFDRKLEALCFLYDCNISRWSDDITISTSELKFPAGLGRSEAAGQMVVGHRLEQLVARFGLAINPTKTRLAGRHQRQMVAGIVVNERLNVRRRYIIGIRRQLHEWRVHGLEEAAARFNERRIVPVDYFQSLFGRIQHIGEVRGRDDMLYDRLVSDFRQLERRERRCRTRSSWAHTPRTP